MNGGKDVARNTTIIHILPFQLPLTLKLIDQTTNSVNNPNISTVHAAYRDIQARLKSVRELDKISQGVIKGSVVQLKLVTDAQIPAEDLQMVSNHFI